MKYAAFYYLMGTISYVYCLDMWLRVSLKRGGHITPNSFEWWVGFLLHILIWPVSTVILTQKYFKEMEERTK